MTGAYNFAGLPVDADGEGYVVQVSDTRGVLGNALPTSDPDETGVCTVCDGSGAATLSTASPSDTTVDFGYYTQDSGTISPEPVIASTLTDNNGDFSFDGLEDGKYVIVISELKIDFDEMRICGFEG